MNTIFFSMLVYLQSFFKKKTVSMKLCGKFASDEHLLGSLDSSVRTYTFKFLIYSSLTFQPHFLLPPNTQTHHPLNTPHGRMQITPIMASQRTGASTNAMCSLQRTGKHDLHKKLVPIIQPSCKGRLRLKDIRQQA